jgi:CS domain
VLKSLRSFPFKHVPVDSSPRSSEPRTSSVSGPSKPPATVSTSKVSIKAPEIREIPAEAAVSKPGSKPEPKLQLTEAGKQVPIGNGGIGPNYWWTQTLTETTVYMDVPPGTHGKDVAWEVTPSRVVLALKASLGEPLLAGELGGPVRASECMWTLEVNGIRYDVHFQSSLTALLCCQDGSTLVLTFEKTVHTWWASVVKGHAEIDTQKVDSTMKVEDYDDETQAAIRKIMFDQQQKRKGLPTSEELEMQALMEKAAITGGAPFK